MVTLQNLRTPRAVVDDWQVAVRGRGTDVGVTVEGGHTVRTTTHHPMLPVLIILLHDRPTPVASVPPIGAARVAWAAAVATSSDIININVITPRTTRHETRGETVRTRTDTDTTGTIITADHRRRSAGVIMSVPAGDQRAAVGWTTVGIMAAGRRRAQRAAPAGASAGRRDGGTVTTASVTGALVVARPLTGRHLARSGATTTAAVAADPTSQHITVRCSFGPTIAATLTLLLPLVVPAAAATCTTIIIATAEDAGGGTDTIGRPAALAGDVGRAAAVGLGFPVVRYPRLLRRQPVVTLVIARPLVAQQRGGWRRDGGWRARLDGIGRLTAACK